MLESAQSANGLVNGILDRGGAVLAIDAFQDWPRTDPTGEQDTLGFTVFNQTNDANRLQDILTALAYLGSRTKAPTVNLIGLEMGGAWTYFARAMTHDSINLAADLAQFPVDSDEAYVRNFFIPGLRKAGDFRTGRVECTRQTLVVSNGPGFSDRLG